MEAENWKKIQQAFSEAVEMPADQQEAFLNEAFENAPELKRQVLELLEQDAEADPEGFLDPVENNVASKLQLDKKDPLLGQMLGVYKIERHIGQGGMGNVYRATRTEGYTQQVAIKILRSELESSEIQRRFQTEIQVLAALSKHPNIAGLIDANSTDQGSPYIVMEYVKGLPIDRYCERQALPIDDRLKLFCDVCSAVAAAHQHGVIHRDLKPGNILVTDEGVVKLIDFGIAKLIAPELSDKTVTPTRTEHQSMTPEYASPEQLYGESITTASDVYSLGVVLYELLTAERPYRAPNHSIEKLRSLLSETDPTRPSTVVGKGDSASHAKRRLLRGDLDNIVLTALRREPNRRYPGAQQLADDIQRFLNGAQVSARPLSRREQFWRTCKRNPVTASLTVAVFASALFGIANLIWLSQHLAKQSAIESARQQAELLNSVQEFYSATIANRVEGEVPVTHRYADDENEHAIPVPATFTIDLGDFLKQKDDSGMAARLYSNEPFKHRASTGGPRDDFERRAIEALHKSPDDPYYEFITDDRGREFLRYATARTMKASCVKCHNNHKESPRDDWRVGDFRGVLEITRPLERDVVQTRASLQVNFYVIVIATALLIGMIGANLVFAGKPKQ